MPQRFVLTGSSARKLRAGGANLLALVEIKSTDHVREEHCTALRAFQGDFPDADCYLLSRDPTPQRFGRIQALPWEAGLAAI